MLVQFQLLSDRPCVHTLIRLSLNLFPFSFIMFLNNNKSHLVSTSQMHLSEGWTIRQIISKQRTRPLLVGWVILFLSGIQLDKFQIIKVTLN